MADVHDIQSWLNGDKLRSQKIREQYPLIGLIVGLVFLYILGVSVCQTTTPVDGHEERDAGREIPVHDD